MTKKLIYIIGTGRSGTTLLDIMLGNIDNTISLGEINRFYKRNGIPPKRKETSEVYKFWSKIRIKLNHNDETNYKKLEELFYNNEYHSAFIKSALNLCNSSYKKELINLYEQIHDCTEEDILIESSKYPSRALNLLNIDLKEKYDICYLYLKKDPVSVVASFQKKNLEQPSKGFLNSNLYYLLVNTLCSFAILILKLRGRKTCTIKYEDFVNYPTRNLELIQKKLNINVIKLIKKIDIEEPLDTGFLFDGNRIRLDKTIVLKKQKKIVEKNFKYYFTRIFNYIIYR